MTGSDESRMGRRRPDLQISVHDVQVSKGPATVRVDCQLLWSVDGEAGVASHSTADFLGDGSSPITKLAWGAAEGALIDVAGQLFDWYPPERQIHVQHTQKEAWQAVTAHYVAIRNEVARRAEAIWVAMQ